MDAIKKPEIKKWNEDNKNNDEEFIVGKPCRIALPGQNARAYKRGEPVTLKGGLKKDLYFQNKVFYKEDWPAVKEYEDKMHALYLESVKDSKQQTNETTYPNKAELDALKKQNAELKKQNENLTAAHGKLSGK